MKNIGLISFPAALLSMALLLPGLSYAQDAVNSQSSQDSVNQPDEIAAQEAAQMVPARAYLIDKFDAKKAQPGAQFTAKLSENVQLKNGPRLLRGTELVGTVASNDKQADGTLRLALNITEARMKNGETFPVKSTIVGVWGPEDQTAQGYIVAPGEQEANEWTAKTLTFDEIDVVSGVDLHSTIGSDNSGVFVAKKNKNVKLSAGSELALAIAPQGNSQQPTASGN